MVLAGIGVELIADGGVFVFSESLQRLEGSDIESLDRKTGAANDRANDAIGKSRAAVEKSETANRTSAGAVDKSGKAESSALRALNLAKEAATKTGSLEKESLILESRLSVVAKRQEFRMLDAKVFLDLLRGKPKAKASVWYLPENLESFSLGDQIVRWLGPGVNGDGAGWKLIDFRPVPPTGGAPFAPKGAPSLVRYGSVGGLSILSSPASNRALDHPSDALASILADALVKATKSSSIDFHVDPALNLRDDEFIIVVSQQPLLPLDK